VEDMEMKKDIANSPTETGRLYRCERKRNERDGHEYGYSRCRYDVNG
jgi:hypothetical protein